MSEASRGTLPLSAAGDGKGLARARLSVGKHSRVITVENITGSRLANLCEDVFLLVSAFTADMSIRGRSS